MSDSEFVSPPTSLTTPILHMACSFNGYDGVSLEMDESSRHTLRQVKKRILKELTAFNLSDLSSSKSGIETEEVVVVDSKSTSSSMRCDKTPSIDVGGPSEELGRLKSFLEANPKSLSRARIFCMGRELKSNVSLKRRIPITLIALSTNRFFVQTNMELYNGTVVHCSRQT